MNVGDVVYIVEGSGRGKPYLYKATVEKIGRKYFYARGLKFDIKTNKHEDKIYNQYNATCYFDPNVYYRQCLKFYMIKRINNMFDPWKPNKITYEQYKQIAEILDIKEPTIEEMGIEFK